MIGHWERSTDGLGCAGCAELHGDWIKWTPEYPPEPKPEDGPVMQCTGILLGVYCEACAKVEKDRESREMR